MIAPLVRSLATGGRLIGIHSCGGDPGMEIVRRVWPDEDPFITSRHDLLHAAKAALGAQARWFTFSTASDAKALFKHRMRMPPGEVGGDAAIGASTLFAAWNAATYNAQIEDHRMSAVMGGDGYLKAAEDVLKAHGGLWFWDESFIISRKRDL